MISVLIADDHPLTTEGSASVLESDPQQRFTVAGRAATAEEALLTYDRIKPDVLLLDVRFGQANSGIDVATDIRSRYADAKIVFVSQLPPQTFLFQAYRLGAMAVLVKNCSSRQLIDAVLSAHAGIKYFLPELATKLAGIAIGDEAHPRFLLDDREFRVFAKLAEGWSAEEIADLLRLSSRSVHTICADVKEKLKLKRAADITRLAIRSGVIEA